MCKDIINTFLRRIVWANFNSLVSINDSHLVGGWRLTLIFTNPHNLAGRRLEEGIDSPAPFTSDRTIQGEAASEFSVKENANVDYIWSVCKQKPPCISRSLRWAQAKPGNDPIDISEAIHKCDTVSREVRAQSLWESFHSASNGFLFMNGAC